MVAGLLLVVDESIICLSYSQSLPWQPHVALQRHEVAISSSIATFIYQQAVYGENNIP